MRRTLAALLTLILVLTGCGIFSDSSGEHRLTILYFSDLHGHLLPYKKVRAVPLPGSGEQSTSSIVSSAGIARLAGEVDRIRRENSQLDIPTLLLVAGDLLQGTVLSTAFRGEAEFQVMNLLRPDAVVLGNHDFDYGPGRLRELLEMADFPVISSNILEEKTGSHFVKPFQIKYFDQFFVGIIGVTSEETPILTAPENVHGLRFEPGQLAFWKQFNSLRHSADFIIGLTHQGLELDRQLAQAVAGLSVIVGGHEHRGLPEPLFAAENRVIVHSAPNCLQLGRLDIVFFKKSARSAPQLTTVEQSLITINETLPVDHQVQILVDAYKKESEHLFSDDLGTLSGILDGERDHTRQGDTSFGNLVTDLMREYTQADVALLNSGSIRSSLGPGAVRLADLMTAFPFDNHLVRLHLTGTDLRTVIDHSASIHGGTGPRGGFLQVSGVSFTIRGGRSEEIIVNGSPIEDKRDYVVVVNDFLADGGDGYAVFRDRATNRYDTGFLIQDLIAEMLRRSSPLAPPPTGRIRTAD